MLISSVSLSNEKTSTNQPQPSSLEVFSPRFRSTSRVKTDQFSVNPLLDNLVTYSFGNGNHVDTINLLRSCTEQFEEFERVAKRILTEDESGLFEASALEISNSALEDRYLHVVYALKCLHLGLAPPESVEKEKENDIVSYTLTWPNRSI
jgi:hypothetical protein